MTYPTRALAPMILKDYRNVMAGRVEGGQEDIEKCMKKVTTVNLKESRLVGEDKDLEIRVYSAGHVLGAAMFYAKVGDAAIVYTGDYNMEPGRHLGAAQIDKLRLDLVVTESTYATTFHESRISQEKEFLKAVQRCVVEGVATGGGKVLILTSALGRAQDICLLLHSHWEKQNLEVPIYFSPGSHDEANHYYKTFTAWAGQYVREAKPNPLDFKHVREFDQSIIGAPGPCVLFAAPGMMSGGFSLEVFKRWASRDSNLIVFPGYCVAGTIGHMLTFRPRTVNVGQPNPINVLCQIHELSFSPHTDAKGIKDLLKFLNPDHVILVHGEKSKMNVLKEEIESELEMICYYPANNETQCIP